MSAHQTCHLRATRRALTLVFGLLPLFVPIHRTEIGGRPVFILTSVMAFNSQTAFCTRSLSSFVFASSTDTGWWVGRSSHPRNPCRPWRRRTHEQDRHSEHHRGTHISRYKMMVLHPGGCSTPNTICAQLIAKAEQYRSTKVHGNIATFIAVIPLHKACFPPWRLLHWPNLPAQRR